MKYFIDSRSKDWVLDIYSSLFHHKMVAYKP